eukprot:m.275474 g.275474  ORF g.275474 m.275474 type:complete len:132 (-) comp22863_c1_seq5:366-761(-)
MCALGDIPDDISAEPSPPRILGPGGVDAALRVFDTALQHLPAPANVSPSAAPHVLLQIHEQWRCAQLRLLQYHSTQQAVSPRLLRLHVVEALRLFPSNPEFWASLISRAVHQVPRHCSVAAQCGHHLKVGS